MHAWHCIVRKIFFLGFLVSWIKQHEIMVRFFYLIIILGFKRNIMYRFVENGILTSFISFILKFKIFMFCFLLHAWSNITVWGRKPQTFWILDENLGFFVFFTTSWVSFSFMHEIIGDYFKKRSAYYFLVWNNWRMPHKWGRNRKLYCLSVPRISMLFLHQIIITGSVKKPTIVLWI